MARYSDSELVSTLLGLSHRYRRLLEAEYRNNGLENWSPSHIAILHLLVREGERTMQELAQKIGRDKSTLTVLVRRLVEAGYIERLPKAEDRRFVVLQINRNPKTLLGKANKAERKATRLFVQSLPVQRRRELLGILQELL